MKTTKTVIKQEDILDLVLGIIGFIFLLFVCTRCWTVIQRQASQNHAKAVYSIHKEVDLPTIDGPSRKVYEVIHLEDDRTPLEKRIGRYFDYAKEIGEELDIEPELILAVVDVESKGVADIYGNGTVGLMQLIPVLHIHNLNKYGYSIDQLTDPYVNMRVGSTFLAELVHKYNDIPFALVCYNKGEGGALASGQKTSYYSDEVMKVYNELKGGDIL